MKVARVAVYSRKTPKKHKENKEKTSRRGGGNLKWGEGKGKEEEGALLGSCFMEKQVIIQSPLYHINKFFFFFLLFTCPYKREDEEFE
jgi:hypothetical protein